jgi:hypothetical protein
VNSVRNSGNMDYTEVGKRTRYAEFWSKLSKGFSQHTDVIRRVFIVVLNACVLGYLITAVMFFSAQGKTFVAQ